MWTDGYFMEGTYTYGYYRELSPAWQRYCLLANGYEAPAPGPDAVHCELGFGQGVSVNIHAAAEPGRFIGTDFNPSHALHANLLCKASGADATLWDLSFAELLGRDDIPMLDSISMHGVWTWISRENQNLVIEFVRRYLKPGGIFYNSYNCFPGWALHHPVRDLLTMPDIYARQRTGAAERVSDALAFAEKAVRANPVYAERNQPILKRLEELKKQNPSYLAHEFLNRDWIVMYFTEVAELLKDAKLSYACTATLLDTLDDVESMNMPEEARAFLETVQHPLMREGLRDYYINRQFRKDLYLKGKRGMTPQRQNEALLAVKYLLVAADPGKLELSGYYRKIDFKPELLNPIYSWLKADRSRPRSFTEFTRHHPDFSPIVLASLLKVMVELNVIVPCQPEEAAQAAAPYCERLNRYLCRRALQTEEIAYLASPVTGFAMALGRIPQMFLHFLWEGKKPDVLAKEVWNVLNSQGQYLIVEGKRLETEKENLDELKQQAKTFTEKTLPVLKALGVY